MFLLIDLQVFYLESIFCLCIISSCSEIWEKSICSQVEMINDFLKLVSAFPLQSFSLTCLIQTQELIRIYVNDFA